MKPLLILHRHNQQQWPRLVSAVQRLNPNFDVVICSNGCSSDPLDFEFAVNALWHLPITEQHSAMAITSALSQCVAKHSHIVADADPFGRELLPMIAAASGIPMVSEITAIDSPQQWSRPAWAGEVEQHWQSDGSPVALTIRSASFAVAPTGDSAVQATPLAAPVEQDGFIRKVINHQSARPELSQAKTVIGVGRGVVGAEQWQLVEQLADHLDAAIGGTRSVIDAGDLPNELQIGQTGQLIAPDLYIGLGISGATQHLAGIKQAKTVVAVNRDADAPFCTGSDYCLVGELEEILPQLMQLLPKG